MAKIRKSTAKLLNQNHHHHTQMCKEITEVNRPAEQSTAKIMIVKTTNQTSPTQVRHLATQEIPKQTFNVLHETFAAFLGLESGPYLCVDYISNINSELDISIDVELDPDYQMFLSLPSDPSAGPLTESWRERICDWCYQVSTVLLLDINEDTSLELGADNFQDGVKELDTSEL